MVHNMRMFSISQDYHLQVAMAYYEDYYWGMANKEIKLTSYKFDANSVKRSLNKLLSVSYTETPRWQKSCIRKIEKSKTTSLEISEIRLVKTSSISAKFENILTCEIKVSNVGYSLWHLYGKWGLSNCPNAQICMA